jgi:hypothetical protein
MPDSENSRTLPSARCKNRLPDYSHDARVRSWLRSIQPSVWTDTSGSESCSVLSLWGAWNDANETCGRLCREQQSLETKMLNSAGGFPIVKLEIPGQDKLIVAHTFKDIEFWLPGEGLAEMRDAAKSELRVKVEKWNAADERYGHSKALAAEAEIAQVEQTLAQSLWETAAYSTADIIAKLHSIVETEDPGCHMQERPWPQLRGVLGDLMRIEQSSRSA